MSQPVIYTQEELEARCKVWQERLRLQDWNIRVRLARPHEIKDACTAQVEVLPTLKEALVSLMYPEDYQHQGLFVPQDMDLDICHELIHVHYPDLDNYDRSSRHHYQLEQGTEALASVIVKAWRRIEELEQKTETPP